ncbi:MAG: hypothetical protein LBS41_02700 [Streptococcaceae bacterium]|nr:hypothetical protein [Streptococcaceae bacterium]
MTWKGGDQLVKPVTQLLAAPSLPSISYFIIFLVVSSEERWTQRIKLAGVFQNPHGSLLKFPWEVAKVLPTS